MNPTRNPGFAVDGNTVIFSRGMAVSVQMQLTGDSGRQADVRAVIEHVLADRPRECRGSIVGSQANDRLETKVVGPMLLSGLIRWKGLRRNIGRKQFGCTNWPEARLLQRVPQE